MRGERRPSASFPPRFDSSHVASSKYAEGKEDDDDDASISPRRLGRSLGLALGAGEEDDEEEAFFSGEDDCRGASLKGGEGGDGAPEMKVEFVNHRIAPTRAAMRKVVQRVSMVVFSFASDDLGAPTEAERGLLDDEESYTPSSGEYGDDGYSDDNDSGGMRGWAAAAAMPASKIDGDADAPRGYVGPLPTAAREFGSVSTSTKCADSDSDASRIVARRGDACSAESEAEEDWVDGNSEISDCGLESSSESEASVVMMNHTHRHQAIVAMTYVLLARTAETPLPGDAGPSAGDLDAVKARDRNIAMARTAVVAALKARHAAHATVRMAREGIPRQMLEAPEIIVPDTSDMSRKERRRARKEARIQGHLRSVLMKARLATFNARREIEAASSSAQPYEVCVAHDLVVVEKHVGLCVYRTLSEAIAAVVNVPIVVIWMHAGVYFEAVRITRGGITIAPALADRKGDAVAAAASKAAAKAEHKKKKKQRRLTFVAEQKAITKKAASERLAFAGQHKARAAETHTVVAADIKSTEELKLEEEKLQAERRVVLRAPPGEVALTIAIPRPSLGGGTGAEEREIHLGHAAMVDVPWGPIETGLRAMRRAQRKARKAAKRVAQAKAKTELLAIRQKANKERRAQERRGSIGLANTWGGGLAKMHAMNRKTMSLEEDQVIASMEDEQLVASLGKLNLRPGKAPAAGVRGNGGLSSLPEEEAAASAGGRRPGTGGRRPGSTGGRRPGTGGRRPGSASGASSGGGTTGTDFTGTDETGTDLESVKYTGTGELVNATFERTTNPDTTVLVCGICIDRMKHLESDKAAKSMIRAHQRAENERGLSAFDDDAEGVVVVECAGGRNVEFAECNFRSQESDGVLLGSDVDVTFIHSAVLACAGTGVHSINSDKLTFKSCTFVANGGVSLLVEGHQRSACTVDVAECTMKDGSFDGIVVRGPIGGRMTRNTITGNAGNGVWLTCGSLCAFDTNMVAENDKHGLLLTTFASGSVTGNTIKDSGRCGVYVDSKAAVQVLQNTIESSHRFGIHITPTGRGTYHENDVSRSMDCNVLLRCRPAEPERLRALNMTAMERSRAATRRIQARRGKSIRSQTSGPIVFSKNKVHDGHLDGIVLCACSAAQILENEIYANCGNGIVAASGAWPAVLQNRIHGNKSNGVMLVNEASGIVQGNEIWDQHRNGIVVKWCSTTPIVANTIWSNRNCGVRISHEADIDCLENELRENKICGIWVKDARPTMERNTVKNNGEAGIRWTQTAGGRMVDNDVFDNGLCALSIEEGCMPDLQGARTAGGDAAMLAVEVAETLPFDRTDENPQDAIDSEEEDAAFGGSNTIYGGVLSFPTFELKSMFGGRREQYDPSKENLATLGFMTMLESFGLAPLQIERQALAKANAAARREAALK